MGRRCSEREMQSPDLIGLLGDMQVWGARGRVFESLRPDHIIQGVARFYLATPFYFWSFLPLQNDWLWVDFSDVLPISDFVLEAFGRRIAPAYPAAIR